MTATPAVQIFRNVWRNAGRRLPRVRWLHIESGLINALIDSEFAFELEDVATLRAEGCTGIDEQSYARACSGSRMDRGVRCMSFARSFEHSEGRRPFILRARGNKTGTRVYVGRTFDWRDGDELMTLRCTSFDVDGEWFIGTLTERSSEGPDKVRRRIRITRADIREWHSWLDGGAS